jgi:hypothetical protein
MGKIYIFSTSKAFLAIFDDNLFYTDHKRNQSMTESFRVQANMNLNEMKNIQVADQENASITRNVIGGELGWISKGDQIVIFPAQLDIKI